MKKKKKKGLSREKVRVRWVRWVRWEIIKKSKRNYYFNKKVCIINKLMWVFCKSDSIK